MSKGLSTLAPRVETLARAVWGARATVRSIDALAGDASSRRYARVRLAGDAPATAVLMIQSDSGLSISSDELAVLTAPLREPPFVNVQRYLRSAGVAVPEIYGIDEELLLLEDVGDVTLWQAVREAPAPAVASLYRAAIDELVRLEVAGERRPDPACIAFQQRFDTQLFLWELEHFLEYGFTGRTVDADVLRELRRRFEELAERLAGGPMTLAHRDYHSWNLFVHEGRIRVIDFQDALLAPVPYDLATLLNDRATPAVVQPALERELVAHFLACRAAASGTDPLPPGDFLADYHRFLFQKSLKIVGRFHYLEDVKGRTGYVAMLPDTYATLRRCFDSLLDLEPFRKLLAPSFPELV